MDQKSPLQRKNSLYDTILEFILKNKWPVLIISSAIVVVVLGYVLFQTVAATNQEKASRMYDISLSYINNMRSITNQNDKERIFQEQINNLNGLIQMYPGTVAAVRAKLFLGRVFYEDAYRSGKPDTVNMALNYYRSVSEGNAANFYKALGLLGQAQCEEQKNDYSAAFNDYNQVVTKYHKEGFNPMAVIGMARAKEMIGDINNALVYYKQVVQEYPDSLWSRFAKGKIYSYSEPSTNNKAVPANPNLKSTNLPFIVQ